MANSDPIGGSPMPDRGQQSLSTIAQVVTAICVVITLLIGLATKEDISLIREDISAKRRHKASRWSHRSATAEPHYSSQRASRHHPKTLTSREVAILRYAHQFRFIPIFGLKSRNPSFAKKIGFSQLTLRFLLI